MDNTVVATVMSNLGFQLAIRAWARLVTTSVGDRYVLEAMRSGGYSLGREEQSGHVVLSDHATTGDGVLTALMLMGGQRPSQAVRSPSWPRS